MDTQIEMLEDCIIETELISFSLSFVSPTYRLSLCLSAASTRRKFKIDASCGFRPKNCSLGMRSALIRDVIELRELSELMPDTDAP